MRAVTDAQLRRPPLYVALSPLCETLDALSLLSVAQHLALLAGAVLVYAAWRWRAGRRSAVAEARRAGAALAAAAALYAWGGAGPRPMAALAVADSSLVVVDLHSHTSASHDARRSFDAARNRAWHRAAGFDVAYVTDHKRIDGALAAARANPRTAGGGLVSLVGLEVVYRDEHLNILDSALAVRAAAAGGHPDAPRADEAAASPVLVQTIPERLDRVPLHAAGERDVTAIELVDGAPRGIGQRQRDRALILRIADSLDLALVAGSNNHGWGRTAVGWTLMRVPGWRAMTPNELAAAIERTLRTERRHAARVVERRSPDPGDSPLALALTLPAVAWTTLTSLTWAERVAWMAWALLISVAWRALYSRAWATLPAGSTSSTTSTPTTAT